MSLDTTGDCFEIVNGPEDGTEFPIARAPFDIGADPGCGVSIRLDDAVTRFQARITAVAGGYRVRRIGDAPVWVNGSKAGRIRSRIARSKDIIKVGRTEMCVRLAEGGLASRSYGLPTESDASWAIRALVRTLRKALGWVLGLARGGLFSKLLFTAAVLAVASFFSPWVRGWVYYGINWTLNTVRYALFQFGISF